MTEAEKQALAIYEMICASSGGRPISGNSVDHLKREASAWKARNPQKRNLTSVQPMRSGCGIRYLPLPLRFSDGANVSSRQACGSHSGRRSVSFIRSPMTSVRPGCIRIASPEFLCGSTSLPDSAVSKAGTTDF